MRKFLANSVAPMVVGLGLITAILYTDHSGLDKQSQMLQPTLQLNENCSATVVVSDEAVGTYLITANHCVKGAQTGVINYAADVLGNNAIVNIKYTTVDLDPINDLALIKTTTVGFAVAQVATEKPVEGQEAWTAGYPLGLPRMLSAGFYGLNMLIGEMDHQRASSLIAGGNSGGGLFVIEDGVYKLVGVTSKGMIDGRLPSMFTPIGLYSELAPIRALIDQNLVRWE